MNRNFVSFLIISLLFLGVACMQQKNIEPIKDTSSNHANMKAAASSGSGKGGLMLTTSVCGAPTNINVTNPYVNGPLQPITINWTAGANNLTYDVKVKTGLGATVYSVSGIAATNITTPALFSMNTVYSVQIVGNCSEGKTPSNLHPFSITNPPVVTVCDNLDKSTLSVARIVLQLGVGSLGQTTSNNLTACGTPPAINTAIIRPTNMYMQNVNGVISYNARLNIDATPANPGPYWVAYQRVDPGTNNPICNQQTAYPQWVTFRTTTLNNSMGNPGTDLFFSSSANLNGIDNCKVYIFQETVPGVCPFLLCAPTPIGGLGGVDQ